MLQWLNQNSGAVQGVSAILIAIVTILLAGITAWYVLITQSIANTTKNQLTALLQPSVDIRYKTLFTDARIVGGPSGTYYSVASGTIGIRNLGQSPFRIGQLAVFGNSVLAGNPNPPRYSVADTYVDEAGGRVIPPQATEEYSFEIKTSKVDLSDGRAEIWTRLICNDMAKITEHCFTYSLNRGMHHFMGQPTRHSKLKMRVKAICQKLDQFAKWENPGARS
jgi:hypothetical protein